MPDLNVEIEAIMDSAEKAAASYVYTGTHGGTYLGVAPSGQKLRFTSCDIFLAQRPDRRALGDGRHWRPAHTTPLLNRKRRLQATSRT